VVWDLEEDRLVSARTMALADMFEARRIIKSLRPTALFAAETLTGFHLEPGFIENDTSEILSEFTPAPLAQTLSADDAVVKFLAIVREGTADAFLAEVAPAVGGLANVTHSAPTVAMLELSVPGINKAVTLAEYARSLGIGAADVVAFGDMPNDIEMLRWAGHGYAMASGHPEAIRAAGQQAPHFDDDGVAQVLEEKLAELGASLQ
jgi:hydroxymethylpyrimidine pyrophosphatase-like HAD family hydrolase